MRASRWRWHLDEVFVKVAQHHLLRFLQPGGKVLQDERGIGARVHPDVVALEGCDEALADAVAFRAAHGGEAGHEVEGGGEVDGRACGAGGSRCRPATAPGGAREGLQSGARRSRASCRATRSPLMPWPAVATQEMTSRLWASMAKGEARSATGPSDGPNGTVSPVQQRMAKPLEAQRWLEASAMTVPLCACPMCRQVARLQGQRGLAHQAENPLAVHRQGAGVAPGALQQGRDAPMAAGRPGISDGAGLGQELVVALSAAGPATATLGVTELLNQVGPGHTRGPRPRPLALEPFAGGEGKRSGSFLAPACSSALREALRFHGLAAKQALKLADLGLDLAQAARSNHILARPDRLEATLGHAPPPPEQQARGDAVEPGDGRHRHAGPRGFLNQPDLFLGTLAPAALVAGDDLHAPDGLST